MIHLLRRIFSPLKRDESGTATVEFVLIIPVYIAMLIMSIELGFITMRHALLERGLDIAVREIRLGTGQTPTHNDIKQIVCDSAGFIADCDENLRLELISTDMRAYTAMNATADCTDAADPIKPIREFKNNAKQNELMLMRACYRYEPLFPQGFLGKVLEKDTSGQAAIISTTAFVQEPL